MLVFSSAASIYPGRTPCLSASFSRSMNLACPTGHLHPKWWAEIRPVRAEPETCCASHGGARLTRDSVVQWPFPPFLVAAPLRMVFPKMGSLFSTGHRTTENHPEGVSGVLKQRNDHNMIWLGASHMESPEPF